MGKQNLVPANPSPSQNFEAFKEVELEAEQTKRVKGGDGEEGDDANGIVGESELVDL